MRNWCKNCGKVQWATSAGSADQWVCHVCNTITTGPEYVEHINSIQQTRRDDDLYLQGVFHAFVMVAIAVVGIAFVLWVVAP